MFNVNVNGKKSPSYNLKLNLLSQISIIFMYSPQSKVVFLNGTPIISVLGPPSRPFYIKLTKYAAVPNSSNPLDANIQTTKLHNTMHFSVAVNVLFLGVATLVSACPILPNQLA